MNNHIGEIWEFFDRDDVGWAVLLVVRSRAAGNDYCIHDMLVLDEKHFFPVGTVTCWGDAMFEPGSEARRIT